MPGRDDEVQCTGFDPDRVLALGELDDLSIHMDARGRRQAETETAHLFVVHRGVTDMPPMSGPSGQRQDRPPGKGLERAHVQEAIVHESVRGDPIPAAGPVPDRDLQKGDAAAA